MKSTAALLLLALAGMAAALPSVLTPSWTVKLPFGPPTETNPITALGGSIFFAVDSNGTVWATNITSRKVMWSLRWDDISGLLPFPDQDILVVQLNQGTWAMRASTGALVWVNNTIQPQVFAATGQYYAAVVDNGAGFATMNCYDVLTGDMLWSNANEFIPLFAAGGRVIFQNFSTIVALDAKTGKMAWQRTVSGGIAAVNNGMVVTSNATNASSFFASVLFLDAATGATKSSVPTTINQFDSLSVAFATNGDIAVSNLFDTVLLIKGDTLTLLWSMPLAPSMTGNQALFVSQQVYVASEPNIGASETFNVTAYSRSTGAQLFVIAQPPALFTLPLAGATAIGDYLLFPNLIGYILFSQATGSIVDKSFRVMLPFVPNTQQFLDGTRFVAQDVDGSVSGYNF